MTLSEINAKINRAVRYTADKGDHWQTPVETMSKGTGDCEDYAIAKMAALLADGWPPETLRLVYCKRHGQSHLVLEVHKDGAAWVLDSLGNLVSGWAERKDLVPIFSFNATHFWVRGMLTNIDPRRRLGQWQRMLDRSAAQGVYFTGGAS